MRSRVRWRKRTRPRVRRPPRGPLRSARDGARLSGTCAAQESRPLSSAASEKPPARARQPTGTCKSPWWGIELIFPWKGSCERSTPCRSHLQMRDDELAQRGIGREQSTHRRRRRVRRGRRTCASPLCVPREDRTRIRGSLRAAGTGARLGSAAIARETVQDSSALLPAWLAEGQHGDDEPVPEDPQAASENWRHVPRRSWHGQRSLAIPACLPLRESGQLPVGVTTAFGAVCLLPSQEIPLIPRRGAPWRRYLGTQDLRVSVRLLGQHAPAMPRVSLKGGGGYGHRHQSRILTSKPLTL